MTNRGAFIALEGIEGVGKSTQLQLLREYFGARTFPVVFTREPGGTPVGESVRGILLDGSHHDMGSTTELLLMFAARAEHLAKVIIPALAEGKMVITDRFTDATFAYQGGGRGIDPRRIEILEAFVQNDLRPDRVILLDAPVDIALARAQQRPGTDRFEQETRAFFARVREVYLARAESQAERFVIIDANKPIDEIQESIRQSLQQLIGL